MNRRSVLTGGGLMVAALALAGCQTTRNSIPLVQEPSLPVPEQPYDYDKIYASAKDFGFTLPRINYKATDRQYWRQVVDYSTPEKPGTIIVDPKNKFLYFILGRGKAIRYGVGVGRAGFAWSGDATVRIKREWPKWFPPKDMVDRQPELRKYYKNGMDGGPHNPITARALYLWQGNVDTLYRIHGTTEPSSIGHNASSGCIRMWLQDIIDLYGRVEVGAKVIVLGNGGPAIPIDDTDPKDAVPTNVDM